eukprot:scpid83696/ scgid21066/ 
MLDLELGMINAIKSKFPDAECTGCFFHLSQNVYRHIQRNAETLELYTTNAEFALACKMIPALAFVPTGDVIDYFEVLDSNAPDALDPLLNYFEEYYIGRLRQNGERRTPSFPPKAVERARADAKQRRQDQQQDRGLASLFLFNHYNHVVIRLFGSSLRE